MSHDDKNGTLGRCSCGYPDASCSRTQTDCLLFASRADLEAARANADYWRRKYHAETPDTPPSATGAHSPAAGRKLVYNKITKTIDVVGDGLVLDSFAPPEWVD